MKTVLDKRFVADCRFDAVPEFDETGKLVGTSPNLKDRFYDVGDLHKDAPVGFALRVNKRSKTYIVTARQGARVVTVKVGGHPELLIGKDVPPERNARLLAAEVLARIRRGEDVNQSKRQSKAESRATRATLRKLFADWMEEYRSSSKRVPSPNTIDAVEKAMNRLGTKLLDKNADEVSWRDLEEFFTTKATKMGHQTAAEQTIRWVSSVYNRANHRITLDALQSKVQPTLYVNPATIFVQTGALRDGTELERDYDKKGVRRPLSSTREHFQKWLDYVLNARRDGSSRTGADYMLTTVLMGLRREESSQLLWNDRLDKLPPLSHQKAGYNFVDLNNGVLVLNMTKNRYAHRLPVPSFLLGVLRERRLLVGGSPYVFPRASRSKIAVVEYYSDPRSFMQQVTNAIHVKFGVHDLRRTFGNVVTEMELPERLTKQLLNHRTGGSTRRYTALSIEQLRPIMERIEAEMLSYATVNPKAAQRSSDRAV